MSTRRQSPPPSDRQPATAASEAWPTPPAAAEAAAPLPWPQRARAWLLAPEHRYLNVALGISLVAHGLLAAVQFTMPTPPRQSARDTGLEVILVNGRTDSAPVERQVLAQANIDGGGDHDAGRAASPLPNSSVTLDGDAVTAAQRRQAELEARQRELMAQMARSKDSVAAKPANAPQDSPQANANQDASVPMARQLAEIAARIEDYNKRPRRHFFAPSTSEYRFAQYVEDWRQRIETVGNLNYPSAARGRLYGSLRMTVYIRSDGSVERVEFDQPSEHRVLNDAARRTVELAAPFARFPADIARDTDVLAITRTWRFTNDKLTATSG